MDRAATTIISLSALAEALDGRVHGDPETLISGPAGLDDAGPGSLVRVEHVRYLEAALRSPAAALLVSAGIQTGDRPSIQVENVRLGFIRCLELFDQEPSPAAGIHPTAVVGDAVEIGEHCSIGAYAVIGDRVRLARDVVVHPHAVIGDDAEVGEACILFPQSVLYPGTVLGQRVRIHAGTVIGSDGFGYEWDGRRHRKRPHIGRVRIADDVEIGANTTIDRATTGETLIGPGTKIDNLVQVGHNCHTGAHCLLVSQVGLAGSGTLGNGVVLAGQAGTNTHVRIGDGVQAGGRAGVWQDAPAGTKLAGNPARPYMEEMRIQAALGQLPQLLRRVRELERKLNGTGE